MGREGKAITFVCEDDVEGLESLRRDFGEDLVPERLTLYA